MKNRLVAPAVGMAALFLSGCLFGTDPMEERKPVLASLAFVADSLGTEYAAELVATWTDGEPLSLSQYVTASVSSGGQAKTVQLGPAVCVDDEGGTYECGRLFVMMEAGHQLSELIQLLAEMDLDAQIVSGQALPVAATIRVFSGDLFRVGERLEQQSAVQSASPVEATMSSTGGAARGAMRTTDDPFGSSGDRLYIRSGAGITAFYIQPDGSVLSATAVVY